MQKLISPINKSAINSGYKVPGYKAFYGFNHFGQDMVSTTSDTMVWASGKGKVIAAGLDNFYGYTAIVKYEDAYNHETKKSADIVIRYFHLANLKVKSGQTVDTTVKIGNYGATGKNVTGPHLHFEVDYDTKNYAMSPSSGASNSNIIKMGNDITMCNPAEVMHYKTTSPDNQSRPVTTKSPSWVADADRDYELLVEYTVTPVSIVVTGLKENCQYFYSPDVNDVVGYLPMNVAYPVTGKVNDIKSGFQFYTFIKDGKTYFIADEEFYGKNTIEIK